MRNYVITVCYDGTNFNGWQAQKRASLRTVQEILESAAEKVFNQAVNITASGRTDAGVHALGQVCSFAADTTIPAERIADCLNCDLPQDVKVLKSDRAAENFDACRSAKRKTYVYTLYCSPRENPLCERYASRISVMPDLEKIRSAAELLRGEHDFKAFCAANSEVKTTVRTVYEIKTEREERSNGLFLRFYFTGNGFLYNMVRTMVGTLLDVGYGRKSVETVEEGILKDKKREAVGRTMPAKGLCLLSVEYSDDNFT